MQNIRHLGRLRATSRRIRDRSALAGGQAGFLLMAGYFVWFLVCGAVLIALLGMTLSANKTSIQQARTAREARAADAAIESAINQIRMDPDGRIGAATVADDGTCEEQPGVPEAGWLDYTDDTGTTVRVTATCEASTRRIADPPAGEQLNAKVDVVGSSYGSPGGFPDTVDWLTDCPAVPTTSCYPWRLGIGAANYAASAATLPDIGATLLHTSDPNVPASDATLGIAADVTVASTGLPMLNPPRGEDVAGVSVAGSYRQGEPGPFSAAGGTNSCGLIGDSFPWLVPGSRVLDSDDADGAPECDAAVTPLTNGLDAPTAWNQVTPLRSAPACPAGAGSVATFSPGAYTRTATAAINDLLGGSCPNRVMWFQPGDYWFDVDDTSNAPSERNALILDDPTVRVIMGQPTGGNSAPAAAAATFPEACDRSAAGVSITLTPRTSLRHKRGRLAVCDRTASTASSSLPPAVWQTPDADLGWSGTPNAAASGWILTRDSSWFSWGDVSSSNPGAAWVMDGNNATASFSCFVILWGGCGADVNMTALGIGSNTPAPSLAVGASRVRSLDLLLKASARNSSEFSLSLVGGGDASVQITLYKAGSSTPTCAIGMPAVPDPRAAAGFQNTYSYDLFSPQAEKISGMPRCIDVRDGAGITRADLRGARVDVRLRLYSWVTLLGYFNTVVDIDGMELRAGWDLVPTGGTAGTGWNDAGNITALDGLHTGYTLQCSAGGSCPTATRSMTATGLDNLTNPWVPMSGPLLEAGVVVTGETTTQHWRTNGSFYDLTGAPDTSANSWMRVTVRAADGTQICQVQWPRIPFWGQGIYLDLLGSPGNCSTNLTSAAQLIGASAQLEVYLQRNSSGSNAIFGTRIDHLKISMVTGGSYTGPTSPNLLSSDVKATNGTSASIFGPWSTPKNDLNLEWRGRAPKRADGSDLPLVGGQMVVESLGSYVGPDGEAGVLCCTSTRPAERVVTLTAVVRRPDGSTRERAVAVVRIDDVGGNGSRVTVEDWATT